MSTFKKGHDLAINCSHCCISDVAEQTNSCNNASDLCLGDAYRHWLV
jgi:hypothetical protein